MVVSHNPSTQKARAGGGGADLFGFKASLVYVESFRPTRGT